MGDELPFRPWTPAGMGSLKLHKSPVDHRAMSIMEYYDMPSIRLDDIIGLNQVRTRLKDFLRSGKKSLLIVGPPGTGKSVLALAAAAEISNPIIDVDFSKVNPQDDGILEELANYVRGQNYTLVLYNIDAFIIDIDPGKPDKVIIYDPYIDDAAKSSLLQRVIIYDPYIDDEIKTNRGRKLHAIITRLKEASNKLIATTRTTWLLPSETRHKFDAKIRVPLPDFDERLMILKHLLSTGQLRSEDLYTLALSTKGCNVNDLIEIASRIKRSISVESIVKDYICYSQRLSARVNV